MLLFMVVSLLLVFLFDETFQQEELNFCTLPDQSGNKALCVDLLNCASAVDMIKVSKIPQTCGFNNGADPLVCCPKTTSETACYKYHKQGPPSLLIYKGTIALSKEFPHMAILGFGNENDEQWLCGGSLISENFVLTAAHCIRSKQFGIVQRVRLGDLNIKNNTDDAQPQDFIVKQTYVHPEYHPSSHYHDIALIQLDRNIIISDYVKPACLPTKNIIIPETHLIATGWGKTDYAGESSSHLLKVKVNYVTNENCSKKYKNVTKRKLVNGIVEQLQICAGHPDGNDSCQGDSGGPLQIIIQGYPNYHQIIGITSFGKACGFEDSAGVYTRVSNYIDWIENIVWP